MLLAFTAAASSRKAAGDSVLGAVVSPTPGTHWTDYKGVAIGATTDAVRQKLGNPKEKGDDQDLYVFSENESAQFYYDAAHTVTAIMITYSGDIKSAPTAMQVVGEDAAPRPDGGISKMVRFPKAGYWIAYNRSGGDDVVITIAIQKI